jgi:hypothetical protein
VPRLSSVTLLEASVGGVVVVNLEDAFPHSDSVLSYSYLYSFLVPLAQVHKPQEPFIYLFIYFLLLFYHFYI